MRDDVGDVDVLDHVELHPRSQVLAEPVDPRPFLLVVDLDDLSDPADNVIPFAPDNFLPDLYMKMGLLLLGILGLAVVSYAKEQKIGLIIFSVAFITTLVVCYLILNGYRIG